MHVDLRARLLADATLAGLIGARLHPVVRPQGGALPAAALQLVSSAVDYHLTGASGLEAERVQASCYGATYGSAAAVAAAIKAAVSGWTGVQGGTDFRAILIDGERADHDAGAEAGSAVYRITLDLMVHHRSAT